MDSRRIGTLVDYISTGMSPQRPTCTDFAMLLGFQESPEGGIYAQLDEISKLITINHLLKRFRMNLTQFQQDALFSQFAALYLPALVDRFFEVPPLPPNASRDQVEELKLNNAYAEMMGAISHTPFFTKYLRSNKPVAAGGKLLIRTIAQRLVEVGPTWDRKMLHPPTDRPEDYYGGIAATVIQLLSTVLAAFIKEPSNSPIHVSTEVKAPLIALLRKWERRYRVKDLGCICNRARNQLQGQADLLRITQEMRRSLKNWAVCGLPGCESKANLKVCSRCQTVRYCTPAHQKAHWIDRNNPHKSVCFQSTY